MTHFTPDLGKPHLTVVPDPAPYIDVPIVSPAGQILQTAAKLIDGDRDDQHGSREGNITLIAAYWGLELGCSITPRQVCRMMALLKIARDKNGSFSLDNSIDACGYLAMGGEFGEKE